MTVLRRCFVCFSLLALALSTSTLKAADESVDGAASAPFSVDARLKIKRQIMSKPGVFLNMSDLTDNGYQWSNDVVWEGEDLTVNEKWHIAGFLFQREGYKGVWLQYAFTLNDSTGDVDNFKRWYGGTGGFR